MSTLHNDFAPSVKYLFQYNYECWACGRNQWNAGHHIMGRGLGKSKLETSPLNYCPIHNYPCHIGKSFNDEVTAMFLRKTYTWLRQNGYKLDDKDKEFMHKYERLYKIAGVL